MLCFTHSTAQHIYYTFSSLGAHERKRRKAWRWTTLAMALCYLCINNIIVEQRPFQATTTTTTSTRAKKNIQNSTAQNDESTKTVRIWKSMALEWCEKNTIAYLLLFATQAEASHIDFPFIYQRITHTHSEEENVISCIKSYKNIICVDVVFIYSYK